MKRLNKVFLLFASVFIVSISVAATPVNTGNKLSPDFVGQDKSVTKQNTDTLKSHDGVTNTYNYSRSSTPKNESALNATPILAGYAKMDSSTSINETTTGELKPIPEVSEPATILLFGWSLIGLAAIGRKKIVRGQN